MRRKMGVMYEMYNPMTEALQDTMFRSASAYEKQIEDIPSER